MYVDELVLTARRRWPILFLGLGLTLGLVGAALTLVAPTYQIVAQVLLVPPRTSENSNPFFALGGLESATDVVGRVMMSEAIVTKSIDAGGTDDFEIERDRLVSGPLLRVTARAPTEEAAGFTLEALLDEIPGVLDGLQGTENVPSKDRFSSSVVARQENPEVLRKPQIRAAVVALVLGLAGTLLMTASFDGWVRRKQSAATETSDDFEGSLH